MDTVLLACKVKVFDLYIQLISICLVFCRVIVLLPDIEQFSNLGLYLDHKIFSGYNI
jgi:hypothetical protein